MKNKDIVEEHHNLKEVRKLMTDIAKEHKLELIYLKPDEGDGGYNYGASAGEEIWLAPFKKCLAGQKIGKYHTYDACTNPVECMLITFFHELAHCRLSRRVPSVLKGYSWNGTSRFQYELWISMLGIEYAHKKYGIKFSDQSVQWILNANASYVEHNCKEALYGLIEKNPTSRSYSVVVGWTWPKEG